MDRYAKTFRDCKMRHEPRWTLDAAAARIALDHERRGAASCPTITRRGRRHFGRSEHNQDRQSPADGARNSWKEATVASRGVAVGKLAETREDFHGPLCQTNRRLSQQVSG